MAAAAVAVLIFTAQEAGTHPFSLHPGLSDLLANTYWGFAKTVVLYSASKDHAASFTQQSMKCEGAIHHWRHE